jgi:hypothetical protein
MLRTTQTFAGRKGIPSRIARNRKHKRITVLDH